MVNSPLQDNQVPAFMIVVISWTLLWRNDGDVGSINSSSTLGKANIKPENYQQFLSKAAPVVNMIYTEAVEI